MRKNLLMAALLMVLPFALNACCTVAPGKIVYSDELTGTIEDLEKQGVDLKAAIFVSDKGKLFFYDRMGNKLKKCVLPKSETQSAEKKALVSRRQDLEEEIEIPPGVCEGMYKGSSITAIQILPIIKSNSDNCMTFGPDASGTHYQYCW